MGAKRETRRNVWMSLSCFEVFENCTATDGGLGTVHAESIHLYAVRYSSHEPVQVTVEGTSLQMTAVNHSVQRDIVTCVMSRVTLYMHSTFSVYVLYVCCIRTVRVTVPPPQILCPDWMLLHGGTVRVTISALHGWVFRPLCVHGGELMDSDGEEVLLYVSLSGTVHARWRDPIA